MPEIRPSCRRCGTTAWEAEDRDNLVQKKGMRGVVKDF
jgi:hypothetical protein